VKKIFYNKLIRDGVEEKIQKNGEAYEIRVLDDNEEYEQELLKKVKEEAFELAAASSREEFLFEYADLMVVLDALTHQMEFSEADIRTAIEENVAKKGLYKLRHFLHWSEGGNHKNNETNEDSIQS
jgi:predicted house-cleaning noncanonical NTP pyrophosphatase (MazG superfamily)